MNSLLHLSCVALLLAPALAQETDAPPALQEQVAAELADAEARLKSIEARLNASLEDAQKAEFAAVQQKWQEYCEAAAAMAVALIKPAEGQADYFRDLERNKLTRDRIHSLERIESARAVLK